MAYALLSILIANHALSTGLRTVHALMAEGVSQDLGLTVSDLGAFAGAYNLTFALMQIPVGIALDRYGTRLVCGVSVGIVAIGAGISAMAPTLSGLLIGQAIVGIGCAPALMGGFVFAGKNFPKERFAAITSIMISLGSIGIIATATPLALLLEAVGWRGAFWVLGGIAIFFCILILTTVRDTVVPQLDAGSSNTANAPEPIWSAVRGMAAMLVDYRLVGLLIIGLMAYPIKLTIRSVWVGPYFSDMFDLDPISVGNIAIVISLAVVIGPSFAPLFEKLLGRQSVIAGSVLVGGGLLLAFPLVSGVSAGVDMVLLSTAIFIIGCYVLTYASARSRFPQSHLGRVLSALNFSIFAGAALWQWSTGLLLEAISSNPTSPDLNSYNVMFMVMGTLAMISGVVYLITRPKTKPEEA